MSQPGQYGGGRSRNRGVTSPQPVLAGTTRNGSDEEEKTPVVSGLPPAGAGDPLILILGSFPSAVSRAAGEYYANPRNHFWSIISPLVGIPQDAPYPDRCHAIAEAGITLWDMVSSCRQSGSADSAIHEPVLNDITGFVSSRPGVRLVIANGSLAGRLMKSATGGLPARIRLQTLPSTSPANARMSAAARAAAWNKVICPVLQDCCHDSG